MFDVPIRACDNPVSRLCRLHSGTRAASERRRARIDPFFVRALELDPDFAAAHTVLSTVYGTSAMGAQRRARPQRVRSAGAG